MRRNTASCNRAEFVTTGLFFLVSMSSVSTLPKFHSSSKREKKATEIVITRLGRFWRFSLWVKIILRVDTIKQICFFFFKLKSSALCWELIFLRSIVEFGPYIRDWGGVPVRLYTTSFSFSSSRWGYEPEYSHVKKIITIKYVIGTRISGSFKSLNFFTLLTLLFPPLSQDVNLSINHH